MQWNECPDTDANDDLASTNGSCNPTWADVLADPDGDGNYAEHITATLDMTFDTLMKMILL